MTPHTKQKSNFRFLDWQVYKDSRQLYVEIVKLTHGIGKEYRFEIGAQIIRSTLSISLNIAEGSGKNSDKELNHYMNISMGSLYETVAAVDILRHNELISEEQYVNLFQKLNNIAYQLGSFKKILKTK
jgi:four helix bundle protein